MTQPSREDRTKLVDSLKTAILQRSNPRRIVLFGSALSDAFTYASDIDIALIFTNTVERRAGKKSLFSPPLLIDHPYDLLLYDESEFEQKAEVGGVCQVIRETGRIIYDSRAKV